MQDAPVKNLRPEQDRVAPRHQRVEFPASRAMSEVQSETAFGRNAVAFDVHESDYLVLLANRVSTLESMAFRFPSQSDFEEFLKSVMRTTAGYRDETGEVQTYPRPVQAPWTTYRHEEDVGCLRKLWTMASTASKKAMERLVNGEEDSKQKITITMAQELEDKAIDQGMPAPGSDKERPSLHALGRVQSNFGPNGNFAHLPWECYMNMEVEGQLRRAGKLPKDKKEIVLDGVKLGFKADEVDVMDLVNVVDLLTLQDVFEIRARAFHMLDVCKYQTSLHYSGRIISRLRATTAEGMRAPTMNEARRADREIMSEVLKWVSKGKGSVELGLTHYVSHPEEELWKLLAQQVEGHPDQGKERPVKSSKDPHERKEGGGVKRPSPPREKNESSSSKRAKESGDQPPRLCLVM